MLNVSNMMKKSISLSTSPKKSRQKWIETGYSLFCEEGHEGIQIERLSRMTGLNKSGFYHYFGDFEGFFEALMEEHHSRMNQIALVLPTLTSYDPDFLNLIVANKVCFCFHIQLARNKRIRIFEETLLSANTKLDKTASELFAKELGLSEVAAERYHEMVRDIFFTRAEHKILTYDFLHTLLQEVKETASLINQSPLPES